MTYITEERRITPEQRSQRYIVNINSIILSNGRRYAGFIENVSEGGLAYKRYSFTPMLPEFAPQNVIDLILKMPSGEDVNLNCEIIWSFEHSPWHLVQKLSTLGMGMKILNPPEPFREYVKILG